MTKAQMNAIAPTREYFGTDIFTVEDWGHSPACGRLSLKVAVKQGLVIETVTVDRTYYTVAQLVELLNGCAGWCDPYGMEHYEVDQDGRAYTESRKYTYRMA